MKYEYTFKNTLSIFYPGEMHVKDRKGKILLRLYYLIRVKRLPLLHRLSLVKIN